MKMTTHVKAGINRQIPTNHNETLVWDVPKAKGLRVKIRIRAGLSSVNHHETLVRDR